MLDGERYFAHYPDEGPAAERKKLMSAGLIRTLATIEKEIRHCLESGDPSGDAAGGEPAAGGGTASADPMP